MCIEGGEKPLQALAREAVAVGSAEREDRVNTRETGLIGTTGYFPWTFRLQERLEGLLEFLLSS